MSRDKLKKVVENPYWLLLIMLNHTWDIVKALREIKTTPSNPHAFADYFKNYDWIGFVLQLFTVLILIYLLFYIRKFKNEVKSLTFHLKAENREFNGNYTDAYFHAVSALKPTYDCKMFQALREQFQIIKNCLAPTPEGGQKLVKSDLETLKNTRDLNIEDVLKYINAKDRDNIFDMDIVQIKRDIANLPDIRQIQAIAYDESALCMEYFRH